MKDVYFDDYKKGRKIDSKYDTGNIPLTKSERERHEQINRQRYEQAIRNQQPTNERRHDVNPKQTVNNRERSSNASQQQPPEKQKKRKGCGCGTFFICILLIVALIAGGGVGYGYSLCSKTNYEPVQNYTRAYDLMSDPEIYNVLLVGIDRDEGGTSRSDTMMLVSVDSKTSTIKFTSFMRDIWVDIPGNDSAKLNAAFAYGGTGLLMQTIEENFKVRIDNYVMVDFDVFKALIDGLGGIEVEVTEAEAEFINRTTSVVVTSGVNKMNGRTALIYCRIRKLDSDFNRTMRQRKVMESILRKVRTQSILDTFKAATSILPLITTDITPIDMVKKAICAPKYISYSNDELRLPVDGTYVNKTIHSQAALVIDEDENINALQKFIYG